jgi:hypothetical protein
MVSLCVLRVLWQILNPSVSRLAAFAGGLASAANAFSSPFSRSISGRTAFDSARSSSTPLPQNHSGCKRRTSENSPPLALRRETTVAMVLRLDFCRGLESEAKGLGREVKSKPSHLLDAAQKVGHSQFQDQKRNTTQYTITLAIRQSAYRSI